MLISFPTIDWLDEFEATYTRDEELQKLIKLCLEEKLSSTYTTRDGLLLYNGKLYIPQDED